MAKLMFRAGKLLFRNGKLLFHAPGVNSPCCCEEEPDDEFTPGDDCPTFCEVGTTPAQWNVVFSGLTDDNCASSAYYNGFTFRFDQDVGDPCLWNGENPDVEDGTLSGPCGLGPATLEVNATYIEIGISEVGGAVFFRAAHTSGDPCNGPLNFTYHSQVGAPNLQLNWTAATATATAI